MAEFNIIESTRIYLNTDLNSLLETVDFEDDGDGVYIKRWNRPEPQPTLSQLQTIYENNTREIWVCCEVRCKRNELLAECDYVVIRHRDQQEAIANGISTQSTLTDEQYIQVLAYRATLRDMTSTIQIGDSFPQKPFAF